MFAQHGRTALIAGLMTAALCAPAWSADDAVKPEAPVAMAASPQAGPVIARESLATEASARTTVTVGENQPTRSTGNPTVGRRYAGTRASVGVDRPVHRYSLILGIGY